MTARPTIPTHLRQYPWYAPHQAWLRDQGLPHHDPGDASPKRANLVEADLARADLAHAYLARADLRRADLDGADMRGANMRGANLAGADLSGAILTGAILTGAILTDADLTDAILTGADLTGAILTRANMRGAYLRRAILEGANMRGANLGGATIQDAEVRERATVEREPDGYRVKLPHCWSYAEPGAEVEMWRGRGYVVEPVYLSVPPQGGRETAAWIFHGDDGYDNIHIGGKPEDPGECSCGHARSGWLEPLYGADPDEWERVGTPPAQQEPDETPADAEARKLDGEGFYPVRADGGWALSHRSVDALRKLQEESCKVQEES